MIHSHSAHKKYPHRVCVKKNIKNLVSFLSVCDHQTRESIFYKYNLMKMQFNKYSFHKLPYHPLSTDTHIELIERERNDSQEPKPARWEKKRPNAGSSNSVQLCRKKAKDNSMNTENGSKVTLNSFAYSFQPFSCCLE